MGVDGAGTSPPCLLFPPLPPPPHLPFPPHPLSPYPPRLCISTSNPFLRLIAVRAVWADDVPRFNNPHPSSSEDAQERNRGIKARLPPLPSPPIPARSQPPLPPHHPSMHSRTRTSLTEAR